MATRAKAAGAETIPTPEEIDPGVFLDRDDDDIDPAELLAVMKGIAEDGIGRPLDDFDLHSVEDIDLHGIADYANAAIRALAPLRAAALRAAEERRARERWRPIESAPRDGTPFLGWCPKRGARETCWAPWQPGSIAYERDRNGGCFRWDEPLSHSAWSWKPTHWLPLTPPAQDGGSETQTQEE